MSLSSVNHLSRLSPFHSYCCHKNMFGHTSRTYTNIHTFYKNPSLYPILLFDICIPQLHRHGISQLLPHLNTQNRLSLKVFRSHQHNFTLIHIYFQKFSNSYTIAHFFLLNIESASSNQQPHIAIAAN